MFDELNQPENKEKVAQKQVQENVSEEEAQKKVVQENVEEKTGKSFDETRRLAIDVLEANEGFEKRNSAEAAHEMRDLDEKKVAALNEKMKTTDLASELVYAGLGPKFLSTGTTALKINTTTMSDKTKEFGDRESMKTMIQTVKRKYPQLTDSDFEQMDPDTLKSLASQAGQDKEESVAEHQLPSDEKKVLGKVKEMDLEKEGPQEKKSDEKAGSSLYHTLQQASQEGQHASQKTEEKSSSPLSPKEEKGLTATLIKQMTQGMGK